ncbi:aromatic amino acid transport family protein [Flavobacterium sp. HSC-61S13]|uniref:aromatic amino acid transport family protein n=1 Tax=Flavobacterium sp. HSC-61S13 TaxID=2910963 RepID=UPI00209E4B5C|nr:aromatic amino acid transport family protein [Flavobacterium sp. HSC-61S13]MCP1996783.1 tyrosine-specific transport protein [Flavobacterium sp. HSC-61S13]
MKNKVLGSILLVAGSSIGGGMLAMPITSAGVGFIGISILLVVIWFTMCYTALLMVTVYRFNSPSDGFDTLTKKYLGVFGNNLAGISLLFLIYALTAAYISGGGSILTSQLQRWFVPEIDPRWGALLFTILFGGIVSISTRWVDLFSRALFVIKILFLILLLAILFPFVSEANLLQLPLEQGLIFTAIPVVFTSFGFHGSIPSIVKYLNGDEKKLKQAFIWGSFLPLIIYLLWQFVVLGSFDQLTFMGLLKSSSGLEGLIISIREMAQTPLIRDAFNVFAATALGTSFLGVSIGLFDYFMDWTRNKKQLHHRFIVSLLTFSPPLIFVLFYPQGFILALGYAAIAGVILALLIPTFLFIKAMQHHQIRIPIWQYFILGFIVVLAMVIIGCQLWVALF